MPPPLCSLSSSYEKAKPAFLFLILPLQFLGFLYCSLLCHVTLDLLILLPCCSRSSHPLPGTWNRRNANKVRVIWQALCSLSGTRLVLGVQKGNNMIPSKAFFLLLFAKVLLIFQQPTQIHQTLGKAHCSIFTAPRALATYLGILGNS